MKQQERILLYGSNLWYLGEGMLGPLFAIFADRVGGNILDIAWAWATYLIIKGLMTVYIGKLSDHQLNKERTMVLGYALNAVMTFCYLLVDSTTGLLIVQAGIGLAAALATPTWSALYSKYEDKKTSGYTWGLVNGQADLVTAFALVIGGLIVRYASFTALFITMGSIQVIATLYQSKILSKRAE